MTRSELLTRLTTIEWDDFEVKEAALDLPKSLWETVSAFSNTNGGWIVLGVKELKQGKNQSFEITGLSFPEKMEQDVITVLRSATKFNTPILASIKQFDFEGKSVLAVYIPASHNKPVYFNNNLHNTFIRVGSGDQRATDMDIDTLMREHTFGLKSEMPVHGTSFDDIYPLSLQTYRRRIVNFNPDFRYNDLDDNDFCHKTRIMTDGSLTFGGLLMFGKLEVIHKYVPNFWIDYIEIPGNDLDGAECRYLFRMPEQENIWEYFKVLMQRLRLFVDNPFMPGPDGYSPEDNTQLYCLREALVNMLAHADYFSAMHSTIRVFYNRIELQNGGKFGINIADLGKRIVSMPRNPNIISFFRYARQSENAGYGIDKIHRWKRITNLDVQFYSDFSYTTVAFMLPEKNAVAEKMSRNQTWNQTLDQTWNQTWNQTAESGESLVKNQGLNNCESSDNVPIGDESPKVDQTSHQTSQSLVKNQGVNNCVSGDNSSVGNESVNNQTRNQTRNQTEKKQVLQKILSIITENPKISRREIARLLNVTDSSAQKLLAGLIKLGIIRREGTHRKGAWVVIKDFE